MNYFCSPLTRFDHSGHLTPPGVYSPQSRADLSESMMLAASRSSSSTSTSSSTRSRAREPKEPMRKNHIKKPLNAFMLYMKEMRPKIVAECTLKESAAINQILGRRVWNYFPKKWAGDQTFVVCSGTVWIERNKPSIMNKPERRGNSTCRCILDGQPGIITHKARKRREKSPAKPHLLPRLPPPVFQKVQLLLSVMEKVFCILVFKEMKKRFPTILPFSDPNYKKCRAKYGLDQQDLWCKPCK